MGSRRKLLLLLLLCCAFASFVSAQSVSITFLDDWGEQTSRVLENGRALLRVVDSGADVSPGPDSVAVSLTSTYYLDSGFTDLVETGDSTGVFEGEMDLTTDFYQNYLNDESLLFTMAGWHPLDSVNASYMGATVSAEAAPSLTDLMEDGADLSPAAFAQGERVRVRVRDKWADLYASQDITTATVTSSGGDTETLVLTETGGRTAVFETSIRLAGGAPAAQDGKLQAAAGETISVAHANANGPSSSSDTAGVTAASVRFIDRREGRSTDLYVEASEVVVRIVDPAANADPGAFDAVAATLYRSVDVEPLTVRETGTDTGVFEGRMRLRIYTSGQGNGFLEPNPLTDPPVTGQVAVTYGALSDTAGIVQSVTHLLNDEGEPASSVALGETVRVRVEAANGLSSGGPDSARVQVRSLSTGDEETLVLLETDGESWIFEGTLRPVSGAAVLGDGRLQAQPGEILEAEHHDYNNVPRSSAQAAVVRSAVRFVDADGRPTSLLLEKGTARLEILDLLSAGQQPPAAEVWSYLAQDSEVPPLAEAGTPGLFAGSIPMTLGYMSPGNGTLETTWGTYPVSHSDTVTAESNGASAEAITTPAILEFVDDQGAVVDSAVAGAPVSMRLVSHRDNASPTAPDSVFATLGSEQGGDMEYLTLDETGPNTSVFLGTVPSRRTYTAGDPDGTLTLRARDSVSATYFPRNAQSAERVEDHLSIVPVQVELLDSQGRDVSAYLFGETVHLRVSEPDANANPGSAETVTATVQAWRRTDSKADVETVTLVETGPDTGVFEGQAAMGLLYYSSQPYWNNDLLEVPDAVPPQGDFSTVTATRGEASDSAAVKDSVLRFTDAAGNDVERVRIGSTIHIRLLRPMSSYTAGIDTDTVQVWTHTGYSVDLESVTLVETGGATGLFTGSLPTAPAPSASSNGILEGSAGTVIEVDKDYNSTRRSFDLATLVQEANQAPDAAGDAASTVEDAPVTILVRSNDSDANGDALAVTAVTQGTFGSVAIDPSGTVTYTPNANLSGSDAFTYTVSDPDGLSDTATVTVTVYPANDPPIGVDDTATTRQGNSVVVPVLANDYDPDGDTVQIAHLGFPSSNGTWAANPDGTLTFTPNVNFHGTETYTYGVRDTGWSPYLTDEATVTVTVTPNIPPNAVDDTVTTNEDTPVTIDVRINDTDAEGDPLTVTSVSQPNRGSVAINANGTVTYTPTANHYGADLFLYTLSDGHGGTDTALVWVTVTPVNDVPDAVADFKSTPEDTPVTITVLSNDTDRDGDTLTVTAVTQPAKGTVVINANNTITLTPHLNKNGSDLFSYTITDGNGGSDTANVSLTISPVNDPPVAVNDTATVAENGTVTFAVIGNDTDPENSTLRVTAVTQGAHGTVTIMAGYQLRYQPAAGYFGPDSFTYTLADPGNLTSVGTVSVTVTPLNDPPTAAADAGATSEDTPVTLSVLANDSDPDGDALTVVAVTQSALGAATTDGTTITFSPAANANGTAAFTYTVRDPAGAEATASVTVTINSVNDAPAASPDAAATNEDTPVTVSVLANDSDVDGGTLSVSAVTQGAKGSVSTNGSTVTYTPSANTNGLDSFTYTVSDGQGGAATATVTLSVAALNDAPATVADSGSTRENVSVILAVLANDTDVEGNPLTVTATSTPPNGITSRLADDTVLYTPSPNFTGTETFTYSVSDGQGGSSVGQVTVVVGEALERVAILATNSVALRAGSDVLSGDVIANQAGAGPFLNGAELSVGSLVTTAAGWDVEGDSVTVAAGATISGDVRYNQLTNSGVITGGQTLPLTLPVFSALPPFLAATPGTTNINVANNGTRTLAAGSYLDLVVGRKGTVTFTGGVYHFRSIVVDREAKLYFSGASEIRVQQKLSTKNLTVVGPSPGATIDASSIVFYVGGLNGTTGGLTQTPKAVEIGVDSTFSANLYAPNGTAWLQDRTQATGAFVGRDIDLGADVQVTLDSAFSGGQ